MTKKYHTKIVQQIIETISKLDDEAYVKKLPVLHDNSLGQHFRHVLEFYLCLLEARENGIVNYDQRKRDLYIETDKSYAIIVANNILANLENLDCSTVISLETCFGNETAIIPSNFSRELVYLSEHTIHHFALIKIGVSSSFPAVSLSENFGVAESTIINKNQQQK